jgi:AraC family transcriptional regulator, regulatory protein of adaptative response / methylated-DNA-[protein]-cysteine methyltransferase
MDIATVSVKACLLETPLGVMVAAGTEEGLCLLEFHDRRALAMELRDLQTAAGAPLECVGVEEAPAPVKQAAPELAEYFEGRRQSFSVPLILDGTVFERRVWDALLKIPCGETRSYGGIAAQLNAAGAQRAVGRANGRNRIAIIVPCHRVIDSNGRLHGYGGGLERKRWLLEHEARMAGKSASLWG